VIGTRDEEQGRVGKAMHAVREVVKDEKE